MQLEEPRFVHQVLRGCHPSPVSSPASLRVRRDWVPAAGSRRQQEEGGGRAGSDRQRNIRAKLWGTAWKSRQLRWHAGVFIYPSIYLTFASYPKRGLYFLFIYIYIKINSHTLIYSGWQPCCLSLHTIDKIYQKLHTKSRNCRKHQEARISVTVTSALKLINHTRHQSKILSGWVCKRNISG